MRRTVKSIVGGFRRQFTRRSVDNRFNSRLFIGRGLIVLGLTALYVAAATFAGPVPRSSRTSHTDATKSPETEQTMQQDNQTDSVTNSSQQKISVDVNHSSDTTSGTTPAGPTPQNGARSTNTSSSSVTVNGRNVPIPSNGKVHQTFTGTDGTSNVDIDVQHSQSSDTSGSSTSLNVNVTGGNQTDEEELP